MKHVMKKSLGAILIFLFSCELVVDLDVPFDGPKISLNCVFTPDSVWEVQLGLNRYILDDSSVTFIDNAVVTIADESGTYTLASKGIGVYQSDGIPTAGKLYRVTAQSDAYGTVTATSSAPIPVQIAGFDVREDGDAHSYEATISVTFTDDPAAENFYQVLMLTQYEWYDFRNQTIRTSPGIVILRSDDPTIEDEYEDGYYFDGVRFKDSFFNGKTYTAKFVAEYHTLSEFSAYTLVLRSLSEDYYQYISTVALQNRVSGDPLAQPVNVYNNIQNGFGIFGGYSQSVHSHQMPQPHITSVSSWSGAEGDEIIIYGENLAPLNETDRPQVTFANPQQWGSSATVSDWSQTHLKVVVPHNAATGKIVVRVNARVTASENDFEVID